MSEPTLPPLLLVGGGRMGSAMLAGWMEGGLGSAVVIDPGPAAGSLAGAGVTVVSSLEALPAGFVPGCVVLAVKPQVAPEVLPELARFPDALFLSVMAGRGIDGLRTALGENVAVVRAMPNTPAAIRKGITACFAGPRVDAGRRALADRLMAAVGEVVWVEEEALLDPVTALSGGGPAYVFLLAEVMERAGIAQGLPPALSRRLARATVSGAGALLASSEEEASALRIAVTSPKGTTERALAVLMAEWPDAMERAVAAATARSRELGA